MRDRKFEFQSQKQKQEKSSYAVTAMAAERFEGSVVPALVHKESSAL